MSKTFDRKIDAQRWLTFQDYAEDWRSRQVWRESTAARIESDLRVHPYPTIGAMALAAVRPSDLDIIVKARAARLAPSTVDRRGASTGWRRRCSSRRSGTGSSPCHPVST